MAAERVRVFGFWASPFALRVEWALKLKGVEYEYIDEDLTRTKSPELLHYNPVTKQIPVLVHGDKALAESLVIVQYIDEVWSEGHPIMPKDPYERAQALFWAKFAEDKFLPAFLEVYYKTGEEQQKGVQGARDCLRTLEKALDGKKFFGGETIGYLDIINGWIPYWLPMLEEITGTRIVNNESLPLISAWFDKFLDVELVKGCLPPKERLYAFTKSRREQMISGELKHKK